MANHPNRSKSDYGVTTRDVVASFNCVPGTYVVPAGTDVVRIGDAWAVRYAADAARITGNEHDSTYRYLFVPTDAVK